MAYQSKLGFRQELQVDEIVHFNYNLETIDEKPDEESTWYFRGKGVVEKNVI